jgi:predicted nuclease of restriction endonuclease-like (RecB) superfamily
MKRIAKTATFKGLISAIQNIDKKLTEQASKAVNISLTLRNWIIGYYISKYQLNGADKSKYGENLLETLAGELSDLNIKNCARRQLYEYLKFYRVYPDIVRTVSAQLGSVMQIEKGLLPGKVPTASAQMTVHRDKLINHLSYSMFRLLLEIDDDTKRRFYEVECIRGSWSVRELERQINSLYYERSGLSKNKKKLSAITQAKAEKQDITLNIRDPYVFEFLGLKAKETMAESQVEDALIDKLQEFLLELGHGFCFEARQKRILIGEENGFIDLVFYHRVLKCHVLVELKLGKFSHENVGQLNTYVSWYKKNMMEKGDNPPVGILLCTKKDHALVSYALAGMDNKLFVSKYKLELPKKEEMERFIKQIMPKG